MISDARFLTKSTAKCYAFTSACFTSDACRWHVNGAAHGNKYSLGADGNGSPSPAGKVAEETALPVDEVG